jgi:hypothetical protein
MSSFASGASGVARWFGSRTRAAATDVLPAADGRAFWSYAMRKVLLPLATIAALGFAGVAIAKTETTKGDVKAFNAKAHALTLADGTKFHLNQRYKPHAFKAGEKVEVKWEMKGKTHEALHVYALKSAPMKKKAPAAKKG